jgi:hypothetical protein
MVIWYIFGHFGIFFPFWYAVPKKSGTPGRERLEVTMRFLYVLSKGSSSSHDCMTNAE